MALRAQKRPWPWALAHVMPRRELVSETRKTASREAENGAQLTVTSLNGEE